MRRAVCSLGVALIALIAAPAACRDAARGAGQGVQHQPDAHRRSAPTLRATDENVPIARAAGLPVGQRDRRLHRECRSSARRTASLARRVRRRRGANAVGAALSGRRGAQFGRARRRPASRPAARRCAGPRRISSPTSSRAYMDVIRDEAIVGLNQQNVHVLEVNLQASRDRFQVGDLTRTDVAQSEARLALARAQLQTGAGAADRQPRKLYPRRRHAAGRARAAAAAAAICPTRPTPRSTSRSTTIPMLLAAQKARDATPLRHRRRPRERGCRRSASVVGGNYYQLSRLARRRAPASASARPARRRTAGLQLTLPLFQGGRPAAQVRQAQARRAPGARDRSPTTERGVIAQTRSAYAVWQSSRAGDRVVARPRSNANKLSLEGVRAENSVGTRTILDILNAEQELLNSAGHAGDRAARRLCRRLRAARGDGPGRGARPRARRRPALRSGRQLQPRAPQDLATSAATASPRRSRPAPRRRPRRTPRSRAPLDPLLDTPVDRNPALTTGAALAEPPIEARVATGFGMVRMGDISAEPSMEEILSSIKRIIAEEGDTPGRPRRAVARDVRSPVDLDPPISTTIGRRRDARTERPDARWPTVPRRTPILRRSRATPRPKPRQPHRQAAASAAAAPPSPAEPIVSRQTAAATRAPLEALSRMMVKPEPAMTARSRAWSARCSARCCANGSTPICPTWSRTWSRARSQDHEPAALTTARSRKGRGCGWVRWLARANSESARSAKAGLAPTRSLRPRHDRASQDLRPRRDRGALVCALGRAAGCSAPSARTPSRGRSSIPPPNVTGSLHIGHALDNTLQDILDPPRAAAGQGCAVGGRHRPCRHRDADGGRAPPRRTPGRSAPTSRREAFVAQGLGVEGGERRRRSPASCAGSAARCDWANERFTMDEGFSKAVHQGVRRALQRRACSTATSGW